MDYLESPARRLFRPDGPNGGVADSLDEAQAVRAAWERCTLANPRDLAQTITPATGQQQWSFGKLAARHVMPRCDDERDADRYP